MPARLQQLRLSIRRRWPRFENSLSSTLLRLFVEPDVFHAPAVEMAVHYLGEPLDPRLPAVRTTGIEQDRPGDVRRQPALDLPENGLAPLRVALARLLFDQLLYLWVAIAIPIDARPAAVEYLEHRIGVGPAGLQIECDREILAEDLRKILRGIDLIELAVDIDVLQLVDQQHRGSAIGREIAGRYLDVEMFVGAVAELLHDPAAHRAVFLDVGVIARQFLHLVRRHAPKPVGWRLHHPADLALALGDRVDKGLAVDAQRHCAPELRIVERRLLVIDEQMPVDALAGVHLADRLRHLALDVLHQWNRQSEIRKGDVELAGDEGEVRRARILDDRIFDAVEIRPARLPVVRVARHLDVFVRLELDEFEWAGADRVPTHVRRRHVTGIDPRRVAGDRHRERRLRPLQVKGDLPVAVGGHLRKVIICRFPRIDPQLLRRQVHPQIPGAFDVLGGERLAVMKLDALAQLEGQLGPLLVP